MACSWPSLPRLLPNNPPPEIRPGKKINKLHVTENIELNSLPDSPAYEPWRTALPPEVSPNETSDTIWFSSSTYIFLTIF
jgi:hypothetical protein